MLIEAEKSRFPVKTGESEVYLRFDNRAFLNIEKEGFDFLNISGLKYKAAKSFLRNGLRCWANEFGASEDEIAEKMIEAYSSEYVYDMIAGGVMTALPEPVMGVKKEAEKRPIFRTFTFCSVILWGSPMSCSGS